MKPGKLITIEGTEGAGKSTAIKFIENYFAAKHMPILLTREPGGTPAAEEMRALLLKPREEKIVPETELLLMFAARSQHIQQVIEPALREGKWVVSDRFIDASYAYQGGGRGVAKQLIELLDQHIVKACYPHLTLLFDIDAEKGMQRTLRRASGKDRIEQEQISFFNRVREAYLARAHLYPERIKVVNAAQPIAQVQQQIKCKLDEFLGNEIA